MCRLSRQVGGVGLPLLPQHSLRATLGNLQETRVAVERSIEKSLQRRSKQSGNKCRKCQVHKYDKEGEGICYRGAQNGIPFWHSMVLQPAGFTALIERSRAMGPRRQSRRSRAATATTHLMTLCSLAEVCKGTLNDMRIKHGIFLMAKPIIMIIK